MTKQTGGLMKYVSNTSRREIWKTATCRLTVHINGSPSCSRVFLLLWDTTEDPLNVNLFSSLIRNVVPGWCSAASCVCVHTLSNMLKTQLCSGWLQIEEFWFLFFFFFLTAKLYYKNDVCKKIIDVMTLILIMSKVCFN